MIEVALIGYRGANTGRQAGNTGRWDKSDGILGEGRREVELCAGAKVVNVADDKKTTGALVDTAVGATAGVGTTAGAAESAVVLGAVTDVAATADGGTGTGALVDTTGCYRGCVWARAARRQVYRGCRCTRRHLRRNTRVRLLGGLSCPRVQLRRKTQGSGQSVDKVGGTFT